MLKLALYTLLSTELGTDALHKVRPFRFGVPLVMKKTLRTVSTEADALEFLNRAAPDLPVPRLVDAFVLGDASYAVMTRIPGHNLLEHPLPTPQLHVVAEEVIHFLNALWELNPPPELNGQIMISASGDGLPNPMSLHVDLAPVFPSTLHCYARMGFMDIERFTQDTDERALQVLARDRITWVHTDLRLQNILVKDGHLSGIVDWEDSGWLPRHWQLHMFRNMYMHGVTFDWWAFWKTRRLDAEVEEAYEASVGLITYPL